MKFYGVLCHGEILNSTQKITICLIYDATGSGQNVSHVFGSGTVRSVFWVGYCPFLRSTLELQQKVRISLVQLTTWMGLDLPVDSELLPRPSASCAGA
jgi:hypothetical protein